MSIAKQPKLSLTIISYNEEDYIGNCLQSIANQTQMPDEVILVDNNSTDKTLEIAAEFPFVRIIKEKQQGKTYARNRGFNEAKYPLIARIDSDTQLPKNWVEKVHAAMDERANELCATSGSALIYDLPLKKAQEVIGKVAINMGYFKLSKFVLGHEPLYGSNVILTHKAWQAVQNEVCMNDEDIHEDLDLAIHIARHGKVYYDEEIIVGVAKRALVAPLHKTYIRIRNFPRTVQQHQKFLERFHPKIFRKNK